MDIEVVSTGERIYKADDGACRALLAAFPEVFRRLEREQPTTPQGASRYHVVPSLNPAGWSVGFVGIARQLAIIRSDGQGGSTSFDGPPPEKWNCPQSVIDEFNALSGKHDIEGQAMKVASERERLENHQHSQRSAEKVFLAKNGGKI